ncbi:HNH endonuclease [Myxococcota bacterium]|nr:HNH endonuclease [Myxococcota bacterium]
MNDVRVLILNKSYQPVNVTRWQRAIVMLYSGIAQALDKDFQLFDFFSWAALSAEYGDDTIATVSRQIRVPRVLVLQAYAYLPMREIRFSRQMIFLRDQNTCQYCGKKKQRALLNLDHVLPRSRGGKTNWVNIVVSCIECNLKKSNRTPREAKMKLLKKPRKPTWSDLMRAPSWKARYREWLPFLDPIAASYWNTELDSDPNPS